MWGNIFSSILLLFLILNSAFAQTPNNKNFSDYNNESSFITAKQNDFAQTRIHHEENKLLNFFQGYVLDIKWVGLVGDDTCWQPYQKYLALIFLQEKYKNLKARYAPNNEPTDQWLEIINAFDSIVIYFGSPQQHPNYTPHQNPYLKYQDNFLETLKEQYGDSIINFYPFTSDEY
ncbi:hypothetical protein MRY82_04225 [bacterium]|nr:hypothetical protein [bacterium]